MKTINRERKRKLNIKVTSNRLSSLPPEKTLYSRPMRTMKKDKKSLETGSTKKMSTKIPKNQKFKKIPSTYFVDSMANLSVCSAKTQKK